jgi:hypothetical protein
VSAEPSPTPESVRLEERKRRVRALLETRDDYLPGLRSSLPDADHKPALSRTVPCERCNGSGRVRIGKRKPPIIRFCLACGGTGERRRRGADLPYDMNLEPAHRRLSEGRVRAMNGRELDEELSHLRELEEVRLGVDVHGYGWERARVARDASGSYLELEQAIRRLRRTNPFLRLDSEHGLELIAAMMGPTIIVPGSCEAQLALARRDVALELHRRFGWTAGEIGRALGIGRARVGRLLKGPRRTR